jgi:PPOX class probable F420-dependent enzyme
MEWKAALPLLRENHTGVAISVTPKGHAQSTIVSTALLDDKLGFALRPRTVKLKNIQRTGRAAITVIKLDNRRYVTVEGPASIEPWENTPAHIKRLKDFYASMGRAKKGTDEDFARQMREEERSLILITPEHVYGSLQSGS